MYGESPKEPGRYTLKLPLYEISAQGKSMRLHSFSSFYAYCRSVHGMQAAEEPEWNWELGGADGKQGPGTGAVASLLPMVGIG